MPPADRGAGFLNVTAETVTIAGYDFINRTQVEFSQPLGYVLLERDISEVVTVVGEIGGSDQQGVRAGESADCRCGIVLGTMAKIVPDKQWQQLPSWLESLLQERQFDLQAMFFLERTVCGQESRFAIEEADAGQVQGNRPERRGIIGCGWYRYSLERFMVARADQDDPFEPVPLQQAEPCGGDLARV